MGKHKIIRKYERKSLFHFNPTETTPWDRQYKALSGETSHSYPKRHSPPESGRFCVNTITRAHGISGVLILARDIFWEFHKPRRAPNHNSFPFSPNHDPLPPSPSIYEPQYILSSKTSLAVANIVILDYRFNLYCCYIFLRELY